VRVDRRLKIIFYISFSLLYVSGALEYFLRLFGVTEVGSPTQAMILRCHGIIGLWFLYFFGHFFKAHIWPSLRQIRHRKTGILLWAMLIVLSISVPFLYYLSDENLRDKTVWIHTYLGLFVVIPLVVHVVLAIRDRQNSRKPFYRKHPYRSGRGSHRFGRF